MSNQLILILVLFKYPRALRKMLKFWNPVYHIVGVAHLPVLLGAILAGNHCVTDLQ
uniref:Uncharacterized protein n=1 Tax=Arundo donax TaxID=35708 RepID=A0A0A9DRC2_ARUDO